MINIMRMQDLLKNVSKEKLVQEMMKPTGAAPLFLVAARLQEMQKLEQQAALEQQQAATTVAEDLVGVQPGLPPGGPVPVGRPSPSRGAPPPPLLSPAGPVPAGPVPAAGLPAPPPVRMESGGRVGYAKGGSVNLSEDQFERFLKLVEAEASDRETQRAVASVILNRVAVGGEFGEGLEEVMLKPDAFEPIGKIVNKKGKMDWSDLRSPSSTTRENISKWFSEGSPDVTDGALYFLNKDITDERGTTFPIFQNVDESKGLPEGTKRIGEMLFSKRWKADEDINRVNAATLENPPTYSVEGVVTPLPSLEVASPFPPPLIDPDQTPDLMAQTLAEVTGPEAVRASPVTTAEDFQLAPIDPSVDPIMGQFGVGEAVPGRGEGVGPGPGELPLGVKPTTSWGAGFESLVPRSDAGAPVTGKTEGPFMLEGPTDKFTYTPPPIPREVAALQNYLAQQAPFSEAVPGEDDTLVAASEGTPPSPNLKQDYEALKQLAEASEMLTQQASNVPVQSDGGVSNQVAQTEPPIGVLNLRRPSSLKPVPTKSPPVFTDRQGYLAELLGEENTEVPLEAAIVAGDGSGLSAFGKYVESIGGDPRFPRQVSPPGTVSKKALASVGPSYLLDDDPGSRVAPENIYLKQHPNAIDRRALAPHLPITTSDQIAAVGDGGLPSIEAIQAADRASADESGGRDSRFTFPDAGLRVEGRPAEGGSGLPRTSTDQQAPYDAEKAREEAKWLAVALGGLGWMKHASEPGATVMSSVPGLAAGIKAYREDISGINKTALEREKMRRLADYQ